ncbi:MAG: hypothetical protein JW904_00820 [Spirochaetales bacterium]|nr:hypothetical protein [Spirochaetales bacterium]
MDQKKKLTTVDFSRESVNRAVMNDILQNPVSTYITFGAGILLLANILLFGMPLLFILALGALALGALSFFINFIFRKEQFASKYIAKVSKQLEQQQRIVLTNLKRNLAQYKTIEGLANYSEQAVQQFEKIQHKFTSFKKLLSDKYNVKELTYARFFGTAEQVYLSTLDNLTDIMNTLESVSTIDVTYIKERFTILEGLAEPEDADKREIETLKKRQVLRKQQLARINELLTLNEEAMTQIDASMAAISEAKTKLGRASMNMETAREELQELVRRTKKYSMEAQ